MFIRLLDTRLGGECPKQVTKGLFHLQKYVLYSSVSYRDVHEILSRTKASYFSVRYSFANCTAQMQAEHRSGFSSLGTTFSGMSESLEVPLKLVGGAGNSFIDYGSTHFFPDTPRPQSPSNLTPEMSHLIIFGRDEEGEILPNLTTNASVVSSASFSQVREETHSAETTSAKVPDALQHGDIFDETHVPLSNGHHKRFHYFVSGDLRRLELESTRRNRKRATTVTEEPAH